MHIRNSRTMYTVFTLLIAAPLSSLPAADSLDEAEGRKLKKLIEFGWDEPDPVFMRQHAASLRKSPFDGTVFHVNYQREDGTSGKFSWEAWGRKQFKRADLDPSLQPLLTAELGSFRHNFLRFNVTPAGLDWFDDHSAILGNARLAAWFARETRCPGLLFDVEQYQGKLFEYSKQRDAKSKPYEEYAAQARLRGRQVMQAFQSEYPGLTVFLTGSYSHLWRQIQRGRRLPQMLYGLMPPFLDGMLEAAEGSTKIVDGHELAYEYTSPEQFRAAYRVMSTDVLSLVADPAKYARHYRFSFGIWIDKDSPSKGWNASDFAENGHTPEALERLLTTALQTADEYVWLYTEKPRWWTPPNWEADKLPAAYDAAVRRAKAAAASAAAEHVGEGRKGLHKK